MLSSITPLGERGRNNRFATTAAFFVAGSVFGGAGTGALAGALGSLVVPDAPAGIAAALAGLALAGAFVDGGVGGVRIPTITRQVDERWLNKYRGWVYGAGFGLQLGAALTTIVSSSAVYLMAAAAVLTGSVAAGAVIGVVFGAVRGASILLAARLDDVDALRRFHRRLAQNAATSIRMSVAAQAALSVLGVVAVWRAR